MKRKILKVAVLFFCALPIFAQQTTTTNNKDSVESVVKASYEITTFYESDTTQVADVKKAFVLHVDTFFTKTDSIGIVQRDTTFFITSISDGKVVFDFDSIPLLCADSLDSDSLSIKCIIPRLGIDTTMNVPYEIVDNKIYYPTVAESETSPEWLWWAIAGAALLLIGVAVGVFLFLKNRNKKTQLEEDCQNTEDRVETTPSQEGNKELDKDNTPFSPLNSEIEHLNKEIQELKSDIEKIKLKCDEDIRRIKSDADEKLQSVNKKWQITLEKQVSEDNKKLENKDRQINKLKEDLDDKEQKIRTIRDEVTKVKEAIINDLKKDLDCTKGELNKTQKVLSDTQSNLKETEVNLSKSLATIDRLEDAQKQYSEKISFVPYAEKYSASIKKLFEIEVNINEEVKRLAKKNISDPYYLYKATHRFKDRLSDVDMGKFMVEVEMAARKQMTFTGNGIALLASLSGAEQMKQVRVYFVLNYLSKYIGALQIYIESLIGLPQLIDDLSKSDVEVFKNIRLQLQNLYTELEVKVICPQLFEPIGNNMDLRVEFIDAGYESGDILEIMNCLVFSIDDSIPSDKIFVKAQS